METAWSIYKPTDSEDVPALPGLYAWYLNFINPQIDPNPTKFLAKYNPYLEAFSSDQAEEQDDPLGGSYVARLSGSGRFGDEYSAKLRVARQTIAAESTSDVTDQQEIDSSAAQKILQTLFNDTSVVLSAPLYIGKSDNLNRRIREHLTAIEDAEKIANKWGDDWFVANDNMATFARRLVGLKLKKPMLLFACVPIDPSALNLKLHEAMKWIEKAEYYFNNISRPLLGRK